MHAWSAPTVPERSEQADVAVVTMVGPGLMELAVPQAAVPMTTVAPTSAITAVRVLT